MDTIAEWQLCLTLVYWSRLWCHCDAVITHLQAAEVSCIALADYRCMCAGAQPTFIIPKVSGFLPNRPVAHLPLMLYIPGIDGTGMAASRQFPGLMGSFDFRTFSVPLNDRTPFTGLVDIIKYAHMSICNPMSICCSFHCCATDKALSAPIAPVAVQK